MTRPYIICHMVMSIDGKVTGDFLFRPECADAAEVYYEINRKRKANGFICGRVTMEGSFTGGNVPELSAYEPIHSKEDVLPDTFSGFYAVAFDPRGKLGWSSNRIIDPDGDPGYDGAQIIEVLTTQADERFIGYLRAMGIPYIFAGETEIDTALALQKLRTGFGCETLLLEGGSIINGAFQRADVIDELSLVIAPVVAGAEDQPLFTDSTMSDYTLIGTEIFSGTPVLLYRRKQEMQETAQHGADAEVW